MYRLESADGQFIAMLDDPKFIRLQKNRCYGPAEKDAAEGVVYNGTVYHISDRKSMLGTEPDVIVKNIDFGVIAYDALMQFSDFALNMAYQLTITKLKLSSIEESYTSGSDGSSAAN